MEHGEASDDLSEGAVDEPNPPEQVPTSRPASAKGSQQSSKQSSLMMAQNGEGSMQSEVVGNPLASTPGPHGQGMGNDDGKSPSCRVLGEGSALADNDRMSGLGGVAQEEQQQVMGMMGTSSSSSAHQVVDGHPLSS